MPYSLPKQIKRPSGSVMNIFKNSARKNKRLTELFYITHVDNIASILKRGIYSHARIHTEGIKFTHVYNEEIIEKRKELKAPNGQSLWNFTNLYFNPRNPMLYRLKCDSFLKDIAILGVSAEILDRPDIYVTTGNAAHSQSEILPIIDARKNLRQIIKETDREYWGEADGSKRKIMAECLVPDIVPPDQIKTIYVANYDTLYKIKETTQFTAFIRQPDMFFQPYKKIDLTPRLSLLEGDMFFSRMQTLTVSVNVVRIMGKGVASRAKYQFPDVYVKYQDACRRGQLKMGKPYLYKRESSADYELADEPTTLSKANAETWFLLFATKRHWREPADIHGIEKGLQWLQENYKKNGIKELALPALGCGLGGLQWKEVGPLLCKYLSTLDIPVAIYLPAERETPEEYLTKEFLLPHHK
jgi:hypothetical protein